MNNPDLKAAALVVFMGGILLLLIAVIYCVVGS